ncbi:hypothetical protein ZIOFF_070428 [Zingiber officinale]|uniref:Uncharacterized protein n=1 Tax=Zingiber officinale TaxID=94328 RepID=A0A8J5C535_ZINOF|nr:hypothetical protein ZIOFF_070428 [Zingiber officinale]
MAVEIRKVSGSVLHRSGGSCSSRRCPDLQKDRPLSAISTSFSSTSSCRSNRGLSGGGSAEGLRIGAPSLRILLQVLMAVVLRKVFGSMLHLSGSNSGGRCLDHMNDHPPLGDLNLIPTDAFVQIHSQP